jgi:hypothetical protein
MTPTQEAELEAIEQAEGEDDEPTRIREWRFARLSKLTGDDAFSMEVASSTVDVHELERLLAMGCRLDLAWEILR